ncbi:MAG: LTA synthase family protein [Bacteroidetes bacterium]|nr:MAG: LTA synthase family protein [Bacteroidota bacterium]
MFNSEHQTPFTGLEASLAFLHGARMDFSIVCYILLIPVLLLLLSFWKPIRLMYDRLDIYHRVILLILTILLAANVLVYHFWGNMLNYRALTYLADPAEMLNSFTGFQIIAVIVILIILISLTWFAFRKIAKSTKDGTDKYSWKLHLAAVFFLPLILVAGIRGGWQMLPLNESLISYSSNNYLNQAAFNPAWHLMYDVQNAGLTESNPFNKMEKAVADDLVNELYRHSADSIPQILSSINPNIVVIILESHTADVVGSLGGEKDVSPYLDSLCNNGLLFGNIYSSGGRTDQGIVSILNGWPATPYHSIMRSTEKSKLLPSLPKDFKARGYHTSFYYGGESNFSNMNVYLLNQGFDKIIDEKSFPSQTPHGKWGIYDEQLFIQQQKDMKGMTQPFFSVMMTLSTHEPFDVPGEKRFKGNSEANLFRNAAAYTDSCLGAYLHSVSNEKWYSNTLFIIVADHGHRLPKYRGELQPETRHIPLVFYGEVIKPEYRGMRIPKLGSHHDIAQTLLSQLKMPVESYSWSKNLLSTSVNDFAYYQIESVVGWMEDREYLVYLYPNEGLLIDSTETKLRSDELLLRGQAYVQKLYGEYLDY